MVGQIKTVNGVKKIVPLTAEARAGNPVSTIIAIYSNLVPSGYLPCNGVQFDETQFPALYAILGDNHTPDLRECALVGAGQNTTDTIATHDVYNVGQFKDDQLQDHSHNFRGGYSSGSKGTNWLRVDTNNPSNEWNSVGSVLSARGGDVTRGKRKGVNYCIKATAGLDESDADYVLGVLAPVDEVTLNNMHSVTSNAVANALGYLVWENPDTTASFEAQTIAFDRAVPYSYSRIKIEYRCLNSESYYKTAEVEVGNNTYLENSYAVLTSSRWVIADRLVKNTTRNGCDFSEARLYTNTTNFDTANTRLIPARIWAIK